MQVRDYNFGDYLQLSLSPFPLTLQDFNGKFGWDTQTRVWKVDLSGRVSQRKRPRSSGIEKHYVWRAPCCSEWLEHPHVLFCPKHSTTANGTAFLSIGPSLVSSTQYTGIRLRMQRVGRARFIHRGFQTRRLLSPSMASISKLWDGACPLSHAYEEP